MDGIGDIIVGLVAASLFVLLIKYGHRDIFQDTHKSEKKKDDDR